MSTPIIRSLTATPNVAQPGQLVQVVFDAYDPDARNIVLSGSVTDAKGNTSTVTTTLSVSDPMTYSLTSDDNDVVITQDPNNPTVWMVQV